MNNIMRKDKSVLVNLLEQAGTEFKGNTCKCPFHDDKHDSGDTIYF